MPNQSCLIDALEQRAQGEIVVVSADKIHTAGQLLDRARALRAGEFSSFRGKDVAVEYAEPVHFLECLVALDGWANSMLLLNGNQELALRRGLEEQARAVGRVQFVNGQLKTQVLGDGEPSEIVGKTRWVIPTSGTTGTPKLIPHRLSDLVRTVKYRRGKEKRWGLLYDPSRFAGLQVIFQALCGGGSVVMPTDYRDVECAVRLLKESGCEALSATPSLWRKLAFLNVLDMLDLSVVTLGGETADQKILNRLRTAYPNATLRHIYASTEAGVGFSVSDGLAGFPANYLDEPQRGVELKVSEAGQLLLRRLNGGVEMTITGDALMDKDGWVLSGDVVERRGDRYYFLGRENGSINVGGQKVHPEKLEAIFCEHAGVSNVRIRAKQSSIIGALVVAEVIVDAGWDGVDIIPQLRALANDRLERFERPVSWTIVNEFPLGLTGKMQR